MGLAVGDFEGQRASGNESAQRLHGDRLGRAGLDERRARLVLADLGRERSDVLGRNVRRVGDDEVERPLETREQIALDELDV